MEETSPEIGARPRDCRGGECFLWNRPGPDEAVKGLSAGNVAATRGIVDYAKESPLALMHPPVHEPHFYVAGSRVCLSPLRHCPRAILYGYVIRYLLFYYCDIFCDE